MLQASRHFASWLDSQGVSLAFTTYQAGKLFFVGLNAHGRLTVFNRTLPRVMGLAVQDGALWVSSLWQLWRFEDALTAGGHADGYDRWYVPQMAYTTGDLDIHDIGLDGAGEPVFVATLLSCLARPHPRFSAAPVWQPPFISRLAPEDRCHLNGLAMRAGAPAFVTCVGRSDVAGGWREHRRHGGLVLDVASGETVAAGLSMPHSPRWHQDKLWLLNAGTGEFGQLDPERGAFQPVAFCPGFLRGLSFHGDYAVVGISAVRENRTFQDLVLADALAARGVTARCALLVIDLRQGDLVHELCIDEPVRELFDTAVLPGCRNPGAVGFRDDAVQRTLVLPPAGLTAAGGAGDRSTGAPLRTATAGPAFA